MMKRQFPLILMLLLMISGCGKKEPKMEPRSMKIEIESVTVPLDCTWQSDPNMPLGGVIRGEGMNGVTGAESDVITVNLPVTSDPPTEPVLLTYENISAMNITVVTSDGSTLEFGDDKIATAAYLFQFDHVWPDGSTVTYIVRNIYTGD